MRDIALIASIPAQARAQRRQTTYEEYEKFILNPTTEARDALFPELKKTSAPRNTPLSTLSSSSLETEGGAEKKGGEKAYFTDSTDSLSDTFSSSASDSGSENSSAPAIRSKSD